MTALHVRHRPAVKSGHDGAHVFHQARCTCGYAGARHQVRAWANTDRDTHLAEVAPPEDQRCADTAAHGTKPWDACLLCGRQGALFDL